ncbi:hypothetical protein CY35_05G072100 [Sphagnum magellanicum]|nr:hypothetical protein CY35_05G072100 [Sphagnum magellanicum]KAH9562455.1 hypothetical protein CY35_05G072100 [Sphagnum magellanicum]
MASGDVQSKVPNMVLGSYGKEHMCLFDSRGGLVMPPSAQLDLLQQQQQHQRQWIPDERDAFISWLRGEFAAANAIIDAMCHHLQMSGKPGEYDVVLTCIQARRYNWTVVLHMQQYFSVAEVNFALQQVMWQKKQSLPPEQPSHMPQAQQFYTYPEAIYGGGTRQEMTNGVQDPRELRGDFVIPRFVAAAQQQSGLEERQGAPENLASAGRSDIPGDRRATGPENDARQQLTPANFEASPSLQPPQPPSAHLQPKAYGENQTEAGSRLSEDAIASPSPTLSAHSSHQNLVVDMGGNQSNADNCLNGNSEGHLLGQPEEKLSPPEDSKEEDPQHLPTGKTSKYYSCSESVDGKMINVAEGLQLFENVLDSSETNQLTLLINGIQAAGRKGRTSVGSTRGFNGQGRDTIHFGCQHPEAHSDISEPIPACLQVIIDRLVAWHLIPPGKVPDSCSIHILDEGDYLPPHIDHSHVERPFYTLTLLSECSLVLGHSLAMDAPGDFKGAFHLSLPVGSVLVLQGSSADIARHALSSSPAKRISIMLGKLLPNKTSRVPPQIASLPHPAAGSPPVSLSSWPPAFNSHLPTQGAKGSSFSNSKPHILGPVSGVLPVPTVRLPSVAQVLPSMPSVASSRLKPLFPPVAVNHSSTYAPTAVIPQAPWSAMPRPLPPSRAPSTGTGVFFPSGGVSSGPGRPVAIPQHRRQGSSLSQSPPLLQKTNSLPASFISPAHSPSPTKNIKALVSSSQLSSDGPQGERTILLDSSSQDASGTSLSDSGTSDKGSGKEPVMDVSPTSVTNCTRSRKEVELSLTSSLVSNGLPS